ncbi:Uncharacterised protein [Vibrio cholerae]|nr:Uncharacterised protein [Vibrio cholerae]CSI52121.1 Uncharacterised protein [Vibrio cholerae]
MRAFNRRQHTRATHFTSACTLDLLDDFFHLNHIVGVIGFRQTHHFGSAAHHGIKVFDAEFRIERIDPYHGFHLLVHRVLQRMEH